MCICKLQLLTNQFEGIEHVTARQLSLWREQRLRVSFSMMVPVQRTEGLNLSESKHFIICDQHPES
jgi:hypothetical protein